MKISGLIQPFKKCEYTSKCEQDCQGKNENRETKFSCALRRGLLIVDGYDVLYEHGF